MSSETSRNAYLSAVGAVLLFLAACTSPEAPEGLVGGSRASGRLLLEQYGCGDCHSVPGVRDAVSKLGPPLDKFGRHTYIAGVLPNQPEVAVRWIQHPQALVPGTTMPDLGVNEAHARDMVAYLYSLR